MGNSEFEKPFSYGGRQFVGTSIRLTGSFKSISDVTRSCFDGHADPAFTKAQGGTWNYNAFFEAAGPKYQNADVFRDCKTGELFVPGTQELYKYVPGKKVRRRLKGAR